MKHLIRILVLLLLLLLMVAPSLANGATFQVTASQINVRTGPGIEYPVIGQIYKGYGFPIVAYSPTGNWVQLNLNGTHGWVFRHLGTVHSTGASVPVVAPNPPSTYQMPTYQMPTYQQPTYQLPTYTIPVINYTGIQGVTDSNYINSTVGVLASVNMRRGPSLYDGIVWIIPYGERAKPVARTANATWILLEYNGKVGWVYHRLVAFPPALSVVNLPVQ